MAREKSERFLMACVQMDPKIFDKAGNMGKFKKGIDEASSRGAKLIVFPECALTGYIFSGLDEARPLAEPVPGPSVKELAAKCREKGVYAVMGMLEADGESCYNTAVLAGPKGYIGKYRKTHLPFLGIDRFAAPGDNHYAVFDISIARVGILICYDGSFPEPTRILALKGADMVLLPTNYPVGAERNTEVVLKTRAFENRIYFAAANRVGVERDSRFIGRSQIIDPDGKTLTEAGPDDDTIIYAEVDPSRAREKKRINIPGKYELDRMADRRIDLYGDILKPYPA